MLLGRDLGHRRLRRKVTIESLFSAQGSTIHWGKDVRKKRFDGPPRADEAPGNVRQTGGMPDDLRVNSWLVIPASELRMRFSRSSGPGGQSVNTTDSRVELSFDIAGSPSLPEREKNRALARLRARLADGVITVAAETERSQLMNREAARARLASLLREAVAPPPPPRVPTKPTKGARERRLADKRRRAQTKRGRRYDAGGDALRQSLATGSSVSDTELMHQRSSVGVP
jgi:ribosome-associated protein